MTNITDEVKAEAKGFKRWDVENVVDYADKVLLQCNAILDSEHGEVLTQGGIAQITGPGKEGKSTLLVGNILTGLSIGKDSLCFGISKPWKILYLNGENANKTMQKRCRSWCKYYCIDEEYLQLMRNNLNFINGGFPIRKAETLKDIRGNLKEIKPDILVIDPLKNYYTGVEDSADDMREFMAVLRSLIKEFNISIILVHHTGKKGNENNLYSGRGSSLLADDAETTMSFRKDAHNKELFSLNVIGRNCAEFTEHLARVTDQDFFTLTDKPEPLPDHTLYDILDQLPDQFRTGAFEDKAALRGIKRTTCFAKIKILENNGIITRISKGLYEKIVRSVQLSKVTELNELPDLPKENVQFVQNSSVCTTEPADERGLV